MIRISVTAAVLCFMIGIVSAFAQTATPAVPAAHSSQAAKMSKAEKQAISKICSDQANAKGLHGKARKKFRSECRRTGGKAL